MNPVGHKTLRHIVFSSYVLLTALFCGLLLWQGQREVMQSRHYAENERNYADNLLACRSKLNALESALLSLALHAEKNSENGDLFLSSALAFREAVSSFGTGAPPRDEAHAQILFELTEIAGLMLSAASAIPQDLLVPAGERSILIGEDLGALREAAGKARDRIQTLLRAELDHIELWQRQSLFFFTRLEYLAIFFSLAAILFSVGSSWFLSHMLNTQLRRLSEGSRALSEGGFSFRFDRISNDELGQVMRDFNQMADQLAAQSAALRDKASQLMEAHRHKDRFLANMSHELRTPLNSIIGFAELLHTRSGQSLPPEKSIRYAERILGAAEHLLELISDLLQVAKIDAGVLSPAFSEFNLAEPMEEASSMLRPLAEKKGLAFVCEAPSFMMKADRRLLRQVFINLLSNAIKFTASGSVSIKASRDGDGVRIDIEDTGIGLSPDEQKFIFKDFHRVESGLTTNYEGVGLGLTLCKRLVELHGGRIIVRSEPGSGSTFSVYIPAMCLLENKL